MTDRIRTLTVLLDRDYRTDDVETVMACLKMIRGVADVQMGDITDVGEHFKRQMYISEHGMMISALATCNDTEFVSEVKTAYLKLKAKRGY